MWRLDSTHIPFLGSPFAGSLVHHIPLFVHWSPPSESRFVGDEELPAFLARLSPSNLQALDASPRALKLAQWKILLAHPSMQRLRILHMFKMVGGGLQQVDEELLRIIVALPMLHTLASRPFESPQAWLLLSSAPALTLLTLTDALAHAESSVLPFVAECGHLTHLDMRSPWLYGSAFATFFASQNIQQLQRLRISMYYAQNEDEFVVSPEEYAAAFASMRCLTSLTLDGIDHIDSMLPHVSSAPVLRHLTLAATCPLILGDVSVTVPSAAILLALMQARPGLRVALTRPRAADYRSNSKFNEATRLVAQLAAAEELQPLSERIVMTDQ